MSSIKKWNRREMLTVGGQVMVMGSLGLVTGQLLGCGISSTLADNSGSTSGSTDDESYSVSWASGGTQLITAPYPDDALFAALGACPVAVTAAKTLGPCYFRDTTGEDISLGYEGLPTQLCLRLIDANCNPLSGYKIEVWHCDVDGIYSGDTSNSTNASSFNSSFCTGNDSAALKSTWYRGMLTTNANGRVNFKTCFPGWYQGRTIHVHFAIVDSSNVRRLVSQFCFSDTLTDTIYTTHELYKHRGSQSTPLSSGKDSVFPSSGYETYQFRTRQNTDGSLLAYHTIQLLS